MFVRIGNTDFRLADVEGKSIPELKEMFGHIHESHILELYNKVNLKTTKKSKKDEL